MAISVHDKGDENNKTKQKANMKSMDFSNKGWCGIFFPRKVWGIADVSSVSPPSEQSEGLWGNRYFTPNLMAEYH